MDTSQLLPLLRSSYTFPDQVNIHAYFPLVVSTFICNSLITTLWCFPDNPIRMMRSFYFNLINQVTLCPMQQGLQLPQCFKCLNSVWSFMFSPQKCLSSSITSKKKKRKERQSPMASRVQVSLVPWKSRRAEPVLFTLDAPRGIHREIRGRSSWEELAIKNTLPSHTWVSVL